MEIKRSGSQPSAKGPSEYFTGSLRIDPLFTVSAPARVSCASVTFESGARTAWHTHPLGQVLVFDRTIGLDEVPDGYRETDERTSLKVVIKP